MKLEKRTPSWPGVSTEHRGTPGCFCCRGTWMECSKGWDLPGVAGPPSAVPDGFGDVPLVHGTAVCREHCLLFPHTELRACGLEY